LYAIVKTWMAQFKRGDFSTCDAPRPGRLKTVTTQEILNQIHELILKDRRISAKSIAEQLGISRERVGSIIHEDSDMRKLSAKWVPKCLNADQKRQRCQSSEQRLEFFRRDPNDFLSRLVAMDETWLCHYDPETKQQSVEWRHNGSRRPQKFRAQKSSGKVLASIFGDQDGILLIDCLPKAQTVNAEYYWSLLVQLKDFWRKNAAGRSPRGSCYCTTMPRLTGHLQPRRNWPFWASSVSITHPIFRIKPRRTTTSSLDWKNIWKVAIFLPTRKSLLPGRPDWTDNLLNLSALQKLERRAKKCIELRGEYVE